jgi:hypothetical protein
VRRRKEKKTCLLFLIEITEISYFPKMFNAKLAMSNEQGKKKWQIKYREREGEKGKGEKEKGKKNLFIVSH